MLQQWRERLKTRQKRACKLSKNTKIVEMSRAFKYFSKWRCILNQLKKDRHRRDQRRAFQSWRMRAKERALLRRWGLENSGDPLTFSRSKIKGNVSRDLNSWKIQSAPNFVEFGLNDNEIRKPLTLQAKDPMLSKVVRWKDLHASVI